MQLVMSKLIADELRNHRLVPANVQDDALDGDWVGLGPALPDHLAQFLTYLCAFCVTLCVLLENCAEDVHEEFDFEVQLLQHRSGQLVLVLAQIFIQSVEDNQTEFAGKDCTEGWSSNVVGFD